MCDFLQRLFTPPGTGQAEAALRTAQDNANTALAAQRQSQDQAKAAADSESEQAQQAKEAAMRKLLAAGGFGATLPPSAMGPAQVGTRQLYGA